MKHRISSLFHDMSSAAQVRKADCSSVPPNKTRPSKLRLKALLCSQGSDVSCITIKPVFPGTWAAQKIFFFFIKLSQSGWFRHLNYVFTR